MAQRSPHLKRLHRTRLQLLASAGAVSSSAETPNFQKAVAKLELSALRYAAAAIDVLMREKDAKEG